MHVETELLGYAQEHEDFIFAVAVRVDVPFTFEHFHQGVELQIAARRNRIFLAGRDTLVVVVPGFFVVAGFGEGAADGLFHAHARGGVALRRAADAEIRTFRIFAESKLDTGERAFKGESRGGLSPTKLDDDGLPSDGICGTVGDVCGGYTSREIAPNRDVVGVEHIGDVRRRGDGHGAFLYTALNGERRMAVDGARRN